jgi:SAM-dependent methyltransferase
METASKNAGLDLEGKPRLNGVWQLADPGVFSDIERHYLQVRGLEGRLPPDDMVRRLPEVPAGHPLAGEWRVRAWTLNRLRAYLDPRPDLAVALDVGCGNGWMAARLAESRMRRVYGLDVNRPELEQAARVFGDNPRLAFLLADVTAGDIPPRSVDLVLLAGAVQYFADIGALVPLLLQLLRPGGELHILDSPFYAGREAGRARARSERYYRRLGCPDMAAHYHHHCIADLAPFNPQCLHDPSTLLSRLRRRLLQTNESPFPWFRIRK